MPTVPSLIPTVALSGQPLPEKHINSPVGAFGGETAQALEGLGKVTAGIGDEIFARAQAMQELNNQSEARDADSKYMIKAGELHANYSALQGMDAVKAYPAYAKSLQDARNDIKGGLSNPMVQKMYDSQSLSTMGRSIFNGAGHAATENRKYAIGTATAQIGLDAKTVEDNPQDESLFRDKLDRVKANAGELAGLQGLPEGSPQEKLQTLTATSKLWSQRIQGMAKTDPFAASTFLEAHKTELTQGDYLQTDNIVSTKGTAVGSVNIATDVFNAHRKEDGTYDATVAQMEGEIRQKAKTFAPDNQALPTTAISKLQGMVNQDRYSSRQDLLETRQTIDEAIGKGNITDVQQLLAMPDMDKVVAKLPPGERNGLQGKINRFNAANDKITNENNATVLNGMRLNDPAAFLDVDLTKEHLSKNDIIKFQNAQTKLRENPSTDPKVQQAIGQIRGSMGAQLEALGIYKRTEANKEDYDHFTGGVSAALDAWKETHGKAASAEDIVTKIAPEVLRQKDEKGMLWGTNKSDPAFKVDTGTKAFENFKQKLSDDVIAKGGSAPTDEQVYKAYVRGSFTKLFGGKKGE